MNKKILFTIVIISLILIGGIIFRQSSNQNISNLSRTDVDVSTDCSSPDCNRVVESNVVEVFYLPHGPITPIREKIKSILQEFPDYTLKEYDFDDNNNRQKIEDYNLLGHIPIAIFINGTDIFLIDGKQVTFKNFPEGDAFVPTLEGSWNYIDLEKVLGDFNKYKDD